MGVVYACIYTMIPGSITILHDYTLVISFVEEEEIKKSPSYQIRLEAEENRIKFDEEREEFLRY